MSENLNNRTLDADIGGSVNIGGDASVSHNVEVGGMTRVRGNVTVDHNLRVNGWLYARNVVRPFLGYFVDITRAPRGNNGDYIFVKDADPLTTVSIYYWFGDEWVDSGVDTDMSTVLAGDYKVIQEPVSDPTTSGNAMAFIDTISQNENGEITVTKKNVVVVTASSSGTGGEDGLMAATDKEKLDGVEDGANHYVHPSATPAAAAAVKVGNDSLGHVVLGDPLTKNDVGLGNVTDDAQVKRTEMASANGVATLDTNGKVPTSQLPVIPSELLPSYVDDVIEAYPRAGQTELSSTWLATGSASGPVITPETGKIYILLSASTSYSANSQFRWGGSAYVKLNDGGVSSITNAEIDEICV